MRVGDLRDEKNLGEAAGGRINDVVNVNDFVTDIARREEVWAARREFFSGDFPVSTQASGSAALHAVVAGDLAERRPIRVSDAILPASAIQPSATASRGISSRRWSIASSAPLMGNERM